MEAPDLPTVKIIIIGDHQTGKSGVHARFCGVNYPDNPMSTIGVEFGIKVVLDRDYQFKAQVWDTGQERFRTIVSSYYRGVKAAVIVYDVTSKASFESVRTWLKELEMYGPADCVKIMLGNKTDLVDKRAVTRAEAEDFADSNNVLFAEVSARANEGVLEAFSLLFDELEELPLRGQGTDKKSLEKKWTTQMTSILDSVHDTKINGFNCYSPMIKMTAPKILDPILQQEAFDISKDTNLWQKIFDNLNFQAREEVSLEELVPLIEISFILDSSSLKKYAMSQVTERIHREKITAVYPALTKATFSNQKYKATILDYLRHTPCSNSHLKILESLLEKDEYSQLLNVREKSDKFESDLIEMDSPSEKKRHPIDRFAAIAEYLFLTRDQTADLKIKTTDVNGSECSGINVHKLVVASKCDLIRSCLGNNFKEAGEGVITLHGHELTSEELEALMKYFYTNSFEHFANPNTCLSILSVSPYLMLTKATNSSVDHSKMLEAIEQTVLSDITEDTCLELATNAHKNQDEELKRVAVKYILQNYANIVAKYEDQFAKLPKALIFLIMNKLIMAMKLDSVTATN